MPSSNTTAYPPCKTCGSTSNERRADKRMRSGWSSNCRPCANAKSLEWKKNNLDRQLATTKAWRQANPDRVAATRAKNIDKEREAALKWRHDNIERARANDAAWRKNNPEKARLKDQKRRAVKLDAARGLPITKDHIDRLIAYQSGLCAYCNGSLGNDYHMDHFVPLAKDGQHSTDNIVLACRSCNLKKGAKDPLQFIESSASNPKKFTESREQSRVVVWSHKKTVRDLMPSLRWLHHSPNGEKRDVITGSKLKSMGVKPGFPDLILPVRSGKYPGLVIEMKSATGKLTDEQSTWLNHFANEGWATAVARSAQAARGILCEYLGQNPDTAPALD